ncbi:MAG: hypothetical protein ACYSU0_21610 [Planctomycetota bacterium]
MRSTKTLMIALSLVAGLGAGCGAALLTDAEQSMAVEHGFTRRLPGSTARIFNEAKTALARMGFTIVSEREGLINAKIELPRKPEPVHINLVMLGGDRVHLRLYNLGDAEKEKMADKIFLKITHAIKGVPDEDKRRRAQK